MWVETGLEWNWITPITYWAYTICWPHSVLRALSPRPHSTLIWALWVRSTMIFILQMRHPRQRKVKWDVSCHTDLKCWAGTRIQGAWLTSQRNRLDGCRKSQKGRRAFQAAWIGRRRGGSRERCTWGGLAGQEETRSCPDGSRCWLGFRSCSSEPSDLNLGSHCRPPV